MAAKWVRRIVTGVSALLVFGALITFTAYRFANPQLTETQLIIMLWPVLIPLALGIGGFWWGMRE